MASDEGDDSKVHSYGAIDRGPDPHDDEPKITKGTTLDCEDFGNGWWRAVIGEKVFWVGTYNSQLPDEPPDEIDDMERWCGGAIDLGPMLRVAFLTNSDEGRQELVDGFRALADFLESEADDDPE